MLLPLQGVLYSVDFSQLFLWVLTSSQLLLTVGLWTIKCGLLDCSLVNWNFWLTRDKKENVCSVSIIKLNYRSRLMRDSLSFLFCQLSRPREPRALPFLFHLPTQRRHLRSLPRTRSGPARTCGVALSLVPRRGVSLSAWSRRGAVTPSSSNPSNVKRQVVLTLSPSTKRFKWKLIHLTLCSHDLSFLSALYKL
jgi:hypothetical protein